MKCVPSVSGLLADEAFGDTRSPALSLDTNRETGPLAFLYLLLLHTLLHITRTNLDIITQS